MTKKKTRVKEQRAVAVVIVGLGLVVDSLLLLGRSNSGRIIISLQIC